MSYNGSGTFNINSTGQPVVTGTVISSSAFTALTADLATGLSTCITKDGQTTVAANIPMNSFKFTNLAAGTAAGDSVRVSQLQAGSATSLTVTGTNTYAATASPALTAYTTGNTFSFVVSNSNTSSCTLNIDSLGAKAITRDGTTALISGDLVVGSEVLVVYDGTQFQVVNSNSKTNFNVSTLLTATTLNLTNALGATYGGTGQSSYAVGDLLYASTTTALSKLADVATGNAVISGGVGVAPSYGKIGLTTHVSGTLPTANGGTGLTSFTSGGVVYASSSSALATGSALTFDGTNLGLGVTPSAWGIGKAIQIAGSTGFLGFSGVNGNIVTNTYYDGSNYRYIANGFSSYYAQSASTHLWFTAPSGTAGNAITFTQAMTLDASGNLGLGVTPSASNAGKTFEVSNVGNQIRSGGVNDMNVESNTRYNSGFLYASTGTATRYGQTNGQHQWYTAPSGTAGTAITFTQAMTLDAYGNFMVGTTTLGGSGGLSMTPQGAGPNACIEVVWNGTASTNVPAQFRYNGTAVGQIVYDTSNTAYTTLSDYRLKDNPQPLTGSGAFIDALQAKTWEWKVDGSRGVGFIAHEVQVVSPKTVVGEKDSVDADNKPVYQAMEYGSAEFIANIIAELQSLRARVAQLEKGT